MVAGVDGCPGGWLVALELPLRFVLCPTWRDVVELTHPCLRVAVDMPIGLPGPGQFRACDRAARVLLGCRRQSVFSAPARSFLYASQFSEVGGMSLQSFHLLPKIRQLDEWITPELQSRVWEAHPELTFARLAGEPLRESKKTVAGQQRRLQLLGIDAPERLWKRSQVGPDDFLDAAAMLYCARHPAAPLGTDQRDERGLRMQIYF